MAELAERTEVMTVNIGPHHPATHGVLRLVVDLEGEVVERAVAVGGRAVARRAEHEPVVHPAVHAARAEAAGEQAAPGLRALLARGLRAAQLAAGDHPAARATAASSRPAGVRWICWARRSRVLRTRSIQPRSAIRSRVTAMFGGEMSRA